MLAVIKQGLIDREVKKGKKKVSWVKKLVQLRWLNLCVYVGDIAGSREDVVPKSDIRSCESVESTQKEAPFVFSVELSGSRTLHFRVESEEERDEWVGAIQSICVHRLSGDLSPNRRVYTTFANTLLQTRGLFCRDVVVELPVVLLPLLEIVCGVVEGKSKVKLTSPVTEKEAEAHIAAALKFMSSQKDLIQPFGITPVDVASGQEALILRLLDAVFYKNIAIPKPPNFECPEDTQPALVPIEYFLHWCHFKLRNYPEATVRDMSSFSDGSLLCWLIRVADPKAIDWEQVNSLLWMKEREKRELEMMGRQGGGQVRRSEKAIDISKRVIRLALAALGSSFGVKPILSEGEILSLDNNALATFVIPVYKAIFKDRAFVVENAIDGVEKPNVAGRGSESEAEFVTPISTGTSRPGSSAPGSPRIPNGMPTDAFGKSAEVSKGKVVEAKPGPSQTPGAAATGVQIDETGRGSIRSKSSVRLGSETTLSYTSLLATLQGENRRAALEIAELFARSQERKVQWVNRLNQVKTENVGFTAREVRTMLDAVFPRLVDLGLDDRACVKTEGMIDLIEQLYEKVIDRNQYFVQVVQRFLTDDLERTVVMANLGVGAEEPEDDSSAALEAVESSSPKQSMAVNTAHVSETAEEEEEDRDIDFLEKELEKQSNARRALAGRVELLEERVRLSESVILKLKERNAELEKVIGDESGVDLANQDSASTSRMIEEALKTKCRESYDSDVDTDSEKEDEEKEKGEEEFFNEREFADEVVAELESVNGRQRVEFEQLILKIKRNVTSGASMSKEEKSKLDQRLKDLWREIQSIYVQFIKVKCAILLGYQSKCDYVETSNLQRMFQKAFVPIENTAAKSMDNYGDESMKLDKKAMEAVCAMMSEHLLLYFPVVLDKDHFWERLVVEIVPDPAVRDDLATQLGLVK